MILQETCRIKVGSRNYYHYKNLGYPIETHTAAGRNRKRSPLAFTPNTYIDVKLEHLMRNSTVKVLCKCEDCGVERMVSYDSLVNRENSSFNKTGETLCSSCANHRMSGVNSGVYKHGNTRYPEYISNARNRNIEFRLSVSEFEALTSQPCHYCGGYSKDTNPKSRGNGIDRKNSDIGYVLENCVPCCAMCNFIKNNTPYDAFLTYIRRAYERTKDYEIQK